ncbi:MAG: histidine kinase [Hyphomicrobiaceae bacterium]|nr:histidine kinase [Hyphomicrobiaceae bacterium]MCC0007334.1 histidine kinase [Hyphomicrobiaceae bacterium]
MLPTWIVLATSLTYLLALFAVAHYADRVAKSGTRPSLISNPYIYSLSIAVYCTSWTYYGSVGRAATSGVGFLPIYLGPTIAFAAGWFVLRKILRICKSQRITSIADFIASRYGKSQLIAGIVTVITVIVIIPYIALQLKAVAVSFGVVLAKDMQWAASGFGAYNIALLVTSVLAAFAILFGTRHIEATEHHAGMVVAIAVESVVKLAAFLAVGAFVTYGVFDGFGDLFARAAADPELAKLMTMEKAGLNWFALILLSVTAIVCLPRQFQVTFVENTDENHLTRATWLFPLYLVLINIFVLPIAFGGRLVFGAQAVDADTYVLAFPLMADQPMLTLFVLLGGLSAAAAMVIVETIALSTMVCNDLVMPSLLRLFEHRLAGRKDLTSLLLNIRRSAILVILILSYLYLTAVGETYHLVTIGLVSFCGAAQLAPAILFGIYWRGGTRNAAFAGLSAGFAVWVYTLLLPSFAKSGFLPQSFIDDGLFGLALLKPYALFGLTGLDTTSHALFWSMVFNIGAFLLVALNDRQSRIEHIQATVFVEAFSDQQLKMEGAAHIDRGGASVESLRQLAAKFVGETRTADAFRVYAARQGASSERDVRVDTGLMRMVERLIAGSIGASSARAAMASAVKAEKVSLEEIMEILDETSHVLEYSRQLEQKSQELEVASRELKAANEQLREADRLKDEFMSTVSHELRTPLTSIRSFSEILQDDPEMPEEQRNAFLGIIVSESERLTRLINQVLDLAKIEAGRMQWHIKDIDIAANVHEATQALLPIFQRDGVELEVAPMPAGLPQVRADADRLIQVLINLISNAEKFCPKPGGKVKVSVRLAGDMARVSVIDNGPGIPEADREAIFDKFYQVKDRHKGDGNPLGTGTGLGLTISERIVSQFGGRIWVEPRGDDRSGSEFTFTVPLAVAEARAATEMA